MKKVVLGLIFCLTVGISLFAQDSSGSDKLDSFLRNFARASLNTKIQILQDAEQIDLKGMGPLYLKAIEFTLDNQALLLADPTAQQLSVLAVQLIGESGYSEGKYKLWDLFDINKETVVRVNVLKSLSEIAKNDKEIIEHLNSWVSRQNTLFLSGQKPDYQVLKAAVAALGTLGDPASFPILFTTMSLSFSDEISNTARAALFSIEGNFKDLLIDVIRKNPIREKLAALQLGLASDQLGDEEKGSVAETALSVGLDTSTPDASEKAQLREMRFTAVNALAQRKWSKATPLLIRHFDITVMEYERGIVRKSNFLEAIAGLGSMATHEAAVRLNLYLDLLNTYKEQEKPVDEQIILAVIKNLGRLGDKIATDNLLYVGYLNYSQTVKSAAREAMNNLKTN